MKKIVIDVDFLKIGNCDRLEVYFIFYLFLNKSWIVRLLIIMFTCLKYVASESIDKFPLASSVCM